MKTVEAALGPAKNESERAKHENGAQSLATAKNYSGRLKHENWSRHPRYRRKRVRARVT
jgi:hypothetical protein